MNLLQDLSITRGVPSPFGISLFEGGINFALPSKQANSVVLCLYHRETKQLLAEIPLTEDNKTGNVWHVAIHQLPNYLAYGYKIQTDENELSSLLNDPFAKSMATEIVWGQNNQPYLPLSDVFVDNSFDWEDDAAPNIPLQQLIIYEMHVRGFTQDSSSNTKYPGTFLGIIEKIPHLIDLGINAIELMPIQEFNEMEYELMHPQSKKGLFNYWGYSTVNFFAPMNRYATSNVPGAAINEFKTMVKELHRHQIEIILDVVFNHTAEGGLTGPVLSFKGIDNSVFYMVDKDGKYYNFSGCGNSFNANQPNVVEFIVDCLRYWVVEMHVDGFRFDLASALTRDINGIPLNRSPLIAAITADPLLAKVKLIAEPWDAIGLYHVGVFAHETDRWLEWNGKYRDIVRRFIKSTYGSSGEFAMRISGSEDLYHSRTPCNSINFITAHDGFTLHDLVSYNVKHNLSNGEDNRDGTNDNESWNCGFEGDTSNKKIISLRDRRMRNFHLALMISQGTPMILMGDEYGHTKKGNNNTWCHDGPLNWFSWQKLQENQEFYRFYRSLIHFRKSNYLLQRAHFLTNKDVDWHGLYPMKADWSSTNKIVAFTLKDHLYNRDLYVAFNASDINVTIHIPNAPTSKQWHWIVNTNNSFPNDFFTEHQPPLEENSYKMLPHSAIMLEVW